MHPAYWKPRRSLHRPAGAVPPAVGAARLGQAMVEFVAVLMPLMLIVVAIIQFGLLFGANVTITNAAREGARAGTIYVYNRDHTAYWNDAQRCGAIVTAATQAFGLLTVGAPHFSAPLTDGACPTPNSATLTNGDVTVSYCASWPRPTIRARTVRCRPPPARSTPGRAAWSGSCSGTGATSSCR